MNKEPRKQRGKKRRNEGRRLFCFGLGYSARWLSRMLLAEGFTVAGTTRDPPSAPHAEGITVYPFSRENPLKDPAEALAGVTHILNSIPPDTCDPVINVHGADIIALAPNLQWVGYLSTTGVYGDKQGDWVDEESVLEPTGERGRRRMGAEAAWLDLWFDDGLPVHIFRLASIYGPGRNALEEIKSGRAKRVVKEGQVFSRIHVTDIANILRSSMAHPNPGRVYNVCDDMAAPPQDVIAFAASLLGRDPPPETPFEQAELSDMAKSFYADNKRVRNDRIKDELGVALAYPDYRAGLRSLLDSL